ncbi:MAG: hypothetical protein HY243_13945 [Proteobacteria bacterium]|nr:hypothetical protein [Pseudomonadota bacterium]
MVVVKSKAGCLFLKDTSETDQTIAKPDIKAACIFLKDANGDVRLKTREEAKAGCLFLKAPEDKPRPTNAGCLFLKGGEEKSEQAGCLFLKAEKQPEAGKAGCLFLKGEAKPEGSKAGCLFLKGESESAETLQPRLADVAFYFGRMVAWDMSKIKAHAVRKGLFRADEIDAVELEYKRFMALGCVYGSNAAPLSQRIDDFWHAHILFTEDYAAMCQAVAGEFLHHRPTLDEGDEVQVGRFDLYEASFGTPDKVV